MMRVHIYAATAGGLGIVGAVLAILVTIQTGATVIFAAAIWSLATLLAVVGLYSAWAIPTGKM